MTACSNVGPRRVRTEHAKNPVDVSLNENRHGRVSAQRWNCLMEPAFALGRRSKGVLQEPFELRELFHSLALFGRRALSRRKLEFFIASAARIQTSDSSPR